MNSLIIVTPTITITTDRRSVSFDDRFITVKHFEIVGKSNENLLSITIPYSSINYMVEKVGDAKLGF